MKKKINKVPKKKVKRNKNTIDYWERYSNRNANIVDNGRGTVTVY